MPGLATLLVATPLFGLALTPPDLTPLLDLGVDRLPPAALMAAAQEDDEEGGGVGSEEEEASADEESSDDAAPAGEDDYESQIKERNALTKIHRPLGISTWAAMTVAVVLGTIQYYNLYGFFDGIGENPCVTGDAIFGQGQCRGTPWPHAISAGVTTGLYAATFTVSLMMPDPDDLSSGKGEFAETLRLHKLLRWVHFGGMVLQAVIGIVIANNALGLDRANDYGTLQTLATVHLASGLVTYGALTWAGALMTF